jgi:lipopolysaccharide biosynthesis regulator YciM
MTESTYLSDFKENLMRLGYQEAEIPDILDQLDTVLTEIDFLEVDPECVEANYGMGMAYCSKGSYERAVHPLARAVYLKPELLESVPDKLRLKVSRGISRLRGI